MTETEVRIQATEYTVSALPEDDGEQGWSYGTSFDLTIAYRGNHRWAVIAMGRCLSIDGEWDYESLPSNRTDEWLATHRFDLTTAFELAERHAEDVKINGFTVADVRARIAESVDEDACCDEAYVDSHGRVGHQPWCPNK